MQNLNNSQPTLDKETIWQGSPSQWNNLYFYIICIPLTLAFGLGILLAVWRYLATQTHIYKIDNQRITEKKGVFSVVTHETELFRIRDLRVEEPFSIRIFGLANIILDTTDKSHPILTIKGIKNANDIKESLRNSIEKQRYIKGVREVDYH